jgi:hypothetical protein
MPAEEYEEHAARLGDIAARCVGPLRPPRPRSHYPWRLCRPMCGRAVPSRSSLDK